MKPREVLQFAAPSMKLEALGRPAIEDAPMERVQAGPRWTVSAARPKAEGRRQWVTLKIGTKAKSTTFKINSRSKL